MNSLDSRTLRTGDCFGQKFPVPGEVRYFVSSGSELLPAVQRSDDGYRITVKPVDYASQSQQHNVLITRKGNTLDASPAKLEIYAGDGVLWYTTDPTVLGFHVAGGGDDFRFSSACMEKHAMYTHAFGTPGKYEWRDPHGSGIHGSVEVESVNPYSKEERSEWYEKLRKPATFEIKDGRSFPESVKIVLGQTVFWSIEESRGIAITDQRLLPAQRK